MEFQRGERVNLNFDTGAVEKLDPEPVDEPPAHQYAFPTFVADIQERAASCSSSPPVAPSLGAHTTGFPPHRRRQPKVLAFKQRRERQDDAAKTADVPALGPARRGMGFDAGAERRAIDEENRRKLDGMSAAEKEQEHRDLVASLGPEVLQKLLLRSSLNDGSNEQDFYAGESSVTVPEEKSAGGKKVSFEAQEASPQPVTPSREPTIDMSLAHTDTTDSASSASIHFPGPSQPPDLDPDDPAFLKNLHDKYFPSLPYDPSQLSWMRPIDPADTSSPYHPSQTALNATELRFDFTGALLAPSIARSIPSDRGLHHHAAAPEAAGYTIPELAVLARSKVAAQRCMAYQTLGRVLYRLGRGEFGVEKPRRETDGPAQLVADPDAGEGGEEEEEEEEDAGSTMAAGLWSCVEEGRVVETMTEEANQTKGHLTARTLAQEALWNWRRGGGRTRLAV